MPTDNSIGVKRGPAVFGGELNWTDIVELEDGGREAAAAAEDDNTDNTGAERDNTVEDAAPTQSQHLSTKRKGWVIDNRSSYVANRATGLLKSSFLTVLLAPKEKVLGIDNLTPVIRLFTQVSQV